jgi:hypothetical protein
MKLLRFQLHISVATKKGNVIEYSHDGSKIKGPDDIMRVVKEALSIAFPKMEPDEAIE